MRQICGKLLVPLRFACLFVVYAMFLVPQLRVRAVLGRGATRCLGEEKPAFEGRLEIRRRRGMLKIEHTTKANL